MSLSFLTVSIVGATYSLFFDTNVQLPPDSLPLLGMDFPPDKSIHDLNARVLTANPLVANHLETGLLVRIPFRHRRKHTFKRGATCSRSH
jgi:hypothetical protein